MAADSTRERAMPLAQRAVNALRNADLSLVADLAQKTEADLELVKNLGDKSIEEIKTALAGLGLSLGMRIDNWTQMLDRWKTQQAAN